MKKQLLKLSGLAAAFVLSAGVVSAYAAEPQPAAEGPAVTLEDLKGTYVELFPEFEKDEYKETSKPPNKCLFIEVSSFRMPFSSWQTDPPVTSGNSDP